MEEQRKVFRYKLDFYYQQALIYLVTLVLYGGIRGSFVEARFQYILNDPVVYVILFFLAVAFVTLGLNYLRNRRLIVTEDALVFKHRWHERRIQASDIEWIHIGREARVQTSGKFQVVVFKLKHMRRLFRIRVGRYEREKELIGEMTRLAEKIPRRKQRRWRRPRFTDR
jgi:hypothetical protein